MGGWSRKLHVDPEQSIQMMCEFSEKEAETSVLILGSLKTKAEPTSLVFCFQGASRVPEGDAVGTAEHPSAVHGTTSPLTVLLRDTGQVTGRQGRCRAGQQMQIQTRFRCGARAPWLSQGTFHLETGWLRWLSWRQQGKKSGLVDCEHRQKHQRGVDAGPSSPHLGGSVSPA